MFLRLVNCNIQFAKLAIILECKGINRLFNNIYMYGAFLPDVLQEVAFRIAKGALLACKTWPFAMQKTAFWKGVDCQGVTRWIMTKAVFVVFYRPKVAGTALKQYICNASAEVAGMHGAGA